MQGGTILSSPFADTRLTNSGWIERAQPPGGPFVETPMVANTAVLLSPETILAQMKANGVTHVIWLADSETTGSTS